MSRYILTDVDNTILNFSDAFQSWLNRQGLTGTGSIAETNSICDYLGCERSRTEELIREFSESPEMTWLEPEPHAVDVIRYLHDKGWEFVAITACHDHHETRFHRRNNLYRVFGFDLSLHVTGLNGCKRGVLSSYRPTYWVEDHYENALLGAEVGHTSFVMDRPYNQGDDARLHRVKDWRAIEDVVLGRTKRIESEWW